jgi:hypothetical protein
MIHSYLPWHHLDRGPLAASMAMIGRNGRVSLRPKRGIK